MSGRISVMTCNRVCLEYSVSYGGRKGTYNDPLVKRCAECEVYLKYEGRFCPCCGAKLRSRPKNGLNSPDYKQKIKPKYIE